MAKSTRSRRTKRWFSRPNGVFKILALAVCVACTGLVSWYLPMLTMVNNYNKSYLVLIIITFGGYILVLYAQIIGYILDGTMGLTRGQEIITSGVGAVLHLSTGAILIDVYKDTKWGVPTNALMACASLAIINASILTADAIFAFACYPSRKSAYVHPSSSRTVINNTNNNHNVFYLSRNLDLEHQPLTVKPV